jgi:type IV pilus assembly protein PilX
MKILVKKSYRYIGMKKQAGIALFFALIALVIMSLAAVALIRSVDTNTLIAGNLAFQQSANSSTDAGVEAAIVGLAAIRDASANNGLNVIQNAAHTANITNTAVNPGYFSSVTSALTTTAQLMADSTWSTAGNAVSLPADAAGNTVQYIIQRMCRFPTTVTPNAANPGVAIVDADCLFSEAETDGGSQIVPLNPDICEGNNCPSAGQTPQVRVTVKVTGPRGAVSFAQAFIH